jgi:hypothetical protein
MFSYNLADRYLCGQYARTVRGETKIPNFTDSSAAMRSSPRSDFPALCVQSTDEGFLDFQLRLPPPKQLEPLAMPAD